MEIVFLGTGDGFSKQYYNTNLLLRFDSHSLLIDCGHTCATSLRHYGIGLSNIENIFITHLHGDHIGGLEEIAIKSRYIFKKKVNLYVPELLVYELWEHSLKGGLEPSVDGPMTLSHYFNVIPVQKEFSMGLCRFEIVPTKHIPGMKSYGIRFNNVFYTSDTIFCQDLLESVHPCCDVIVHDCGFFTNPVHTYYKELLHLPSSLREKIYLIHYNDNSEEQRSFMVSRGFHCAERHMSLKIKNTS